MDRRDRAETRKGSPLNQEIAVAAAADAPRRRHRLQQPQAASSRRSPPSQSQRLLYNSWTLIDAGPDCHADILVRAVQQHIDKHYYHHHLQRAVNPPLPPPPPPPPATKNATTLETNNDGTTVPPARGGGGGGGSRSSRRSSERQSSRGGGGGGVLSRIILTNGHADHIGAVPQLLRRFPLCRVLVHERELPFVVDGVSYSSIPSETWAFRFGKRVLLPDSDVRIPVTHVDLVYGGQVICSSSAPNTPPLPPGSSKLDEGGGGREKKGDDMMMMEGHDTAVGAGRTGVKGAERSGGGEGSAPLLLPSSSSKLLAMETPGNTPGSMAYLHVPSGCLFVGDLVLSSRLLSSARRRSSLTSASSSSSSSSSSSCCAPLKSTTSSWQSWRRSLHRIVGLRETWEIVQRLLPTHNDDGGGGGGGGVTLEDAKAVYDVQVQQPSSKR